MPRIAAVLSVLITAVTCIGFNTARYPCVWEMVANPGGLPPAEESANSPSLPELTVADASLQEVPSWADDAQTQNRLSDNSHEAVSAHEAVGLDGPGDADRFVRVESDQQVASEFSPGNDCRSVECEATPFCRVGPHPSWAADYPGTADPAPRVADELGPSGRENAEASLSDDEAAEDEAAEDEAADLAASDHLVPISPPEEGSEMAEPCNGPQDNGVETGTSSDMEPAATPPKVRRLPPIDEVWPNPYGEIRPPSEDGSIPIYASTGVS